MPIDKTTSTRVRFSDVANEEFTGSALDHMEANKLDIWYQQSDMKQIKETAFLLAKQGGMYGIGSLLSNTYGKDDRATMDAVHAWALACGERRGLERFHCRYYAKKRMDVRRKTILSVIKAQHRMLVDERLTDKAYIAVVIGRLAEAYSIESRRFARVLGQADAAAVIQSLAVAEPFTDTTTKKPTPVQRQKTPQSVTMLDQWSEQSNLSPHVVSTPFSKTVTSPSSVASAFLNYV